MSTVTINTWDFPMEVTFDYQPYVAECDAHPGEREGVNLCCVFVGQHDIYEMLNSNQIERIEEAVMREIRRIQNDI